MQEISNLSSHYKRSKLEAFSQDSKLRLERAKAPDTHAEILYYLASDPNPLVREAVALNPSSPFQILKVLASDSLEPIRILACERLQKTLQEKGAEGFNQRKHRIFEHVLTMLSEDASSQVRAALVGVLVDVEYVPIETAKKLASDMDREVAAPMLKAFKAFSDKDLFDILDHHPEEWRVKNVAMRENLSEKLTDFLIQTGHRSVLKKLLNHELLTLSPLQLKKIMGFVKDQPPLEKDFSTYRALPGNLAEKLVGFVGSSILKILMKRKDFDNESIQKIKQLAERRLGFLMVEKSYESEQKMALDYYHKQLLTEAILADGLSWKKFDFVKIGMRLMGAIPFENIHAIFQTKSPKAILSLCWALGLSMRFALALQKALLVHPREILNPRAGSYYPLSESDMIWQLDFFDICYSKKEEIA